MVQDGSAVPRREPLEFAAVYAAHARFVWQLALRLGVSRADCEDVSQEVFLVVHKKLASFDGRSALRTWIYAIVYRAASEHGRKRREHPVEGATLPTGPGQDLAIDARDARRILESILERLDDDKRAVFVLYELEEMTMADVAEIVGCPLQTAYSRLHAARAEFEAAVKRLQATGKRR
jgi:RNA polymerase sigma-70 factor (ECF subfamily)